MDNSPIVKLPDNQFLIKSTGEIVTQNDIVDCSEEYLRYEYEEMNDALKDLKMNTDLKLIKLNRELFLCAVIKPKHTYGRVYRMDVREIMKNGELSINARAFLATFEPYICFPYNSIVVGYKTLSVTEMAEFMGVGDKTMYKIFKELEDKEIIKRVKRNGQTIIYVNPFLYCGGIYVLKETYELFENSIYNPKNK